MSYNLIITSDSVRKVLMKTKLRDRIVEDYDSNTTTPSHQALPLYVLNTSDNSSMVASPEVVADVIHHILTNRKIKVVFLDEMNSCARLYRHTGGWSSSDSSHNFVKPALFKQTPTVKASQRVAKTAPQRDRGDDGDRDTPSGGPAVVGVLALSAMIGIIGFAAASGGRR